MLLLLVGCFGLAPVGKSEPSDSDSATAGALALDASALDFGDVRLGTTDSQDLVLSNTGEGPLAVSLLVDGEAFTVSSDSVSIASESIVVVTFAPATAGPYEASLEIEVDSGEALSLPLSGNGVTGGDTGTDTDTPEEDGALAASPTSHDFGALDLGDARTTTFTVTNDGDTDLTIDAISASNGAFETGGTLSEGQVLSPGASRLLDVTFSPTAETTYTGTVTVTADGAEVTLDVTGRGEDACDICAPELDVDTGGSSATAITDFFYSSFTGPDERTVTLYNFGDEDLVVSDVFVNNDFLATSGTFSVSGISTPVTIAPGRSDTFVIGFRATAAVLEVAQAPLDLNVVHILSNDPAMPDWVIELSGAAL